MGMSSNANHEPDFREILRRLAEHNKNSLSNVLVIGGDGRQREFVAQTFHSAGSRTKSMFTRVTCKRGSQKLRSEFLELFSALIRKGQLPGSWKLELLSSGTLFIDRIEQMDPECQKMCLEFLKQLQRQRSEWPGRVGLRVVAGAGRDLFEAVAEGTFLQSLLDLLDKLRIDLDAVDQRSHASLLTGAFLGI